MKLNVCVKKKIKLIIQVAIITCLLASLTNTVSASTVHVQEQVSERTKQDIIERWSAYLPQRFTNEQLFEVEPTYSAPHNAGQLKDNVLQDALNATNFARYLAGLPDDVTLDYSIAKQQQAGAVLMAELGGLSHYPEKPQQMADDFYQLGKTSAGSSNLSAGRHSLYDTVFFGYMADNSGSNLYSVGHRRWIINPQMKTTMFGLAYNPSSRYGYYSTMHAFNMDRDQSEVEYEYIAWPSAGHFPIEVLTAADPWSVSPNPEIYDRNKTDEIYVTMSRESDNKTWTLNSSNRDENGDFFVVDNGGYGVNFAIIFRPKGIESYVNDDIYDVTIHNLYTLSGEKTSISYATTMFQLQASYKNNATRYAVVGQKLNLPIEGKATRFVSSDPAIASVDSNGVITAHEPGYTTIYVDNYLQRYESIVTIHVMNTDYSSYSTWAESAIIQANEHGILYNNPYYYNLKEAVSREQFVSYVVGMLKAINPKLSLDQYYDKKSPFKDVSYSPEIIWAYEQGLINGTSKDTFSPSSTITREQAATLLLNVYRHLGGEEVANVSDRFADKQQIASWAQYSVKQIAELSIMGGVSATHFDPKGNYSHEQTIITLLRLYNHFVVK